MSLCSFRIIYENWLIRILIALLKLEYVLIKLILDHALMKLRLACALSKLILDRVLMKLRLDFVLMKIRLADVLIEPIWGCIDNYILECVLMKLSNLFIFFIYTFCKYQQLYVMKIKQARLVIHYRYYFWHYFKQNLTIFQIRC